MHSRPSGVRQQNQTIQQDDTQTFPFKKVDVYTFWGYTSWTTIMHDHHAALILVVYMTVIIDTYLWIST